MLPRTDFVNLTCNKAKINFPKTKKKEGRRACFRVFIISRRYQRMAISNKCSYISEI